MDLPSAPRQFREAHLKRIAGAPSVCSVFCATIACFVFILPPTLTLLVLACKRAAEVSKVSDTSYSYPHRLKIGVLLSAVVVRPRVGMYWQATIGGTIVIATFYTPVMIYVQLRPKGSARKIIFYGIGFLIIAAGLALGAALESTFLPRSLVRCDNVGDVVGTNSHSYFDEIAIANGRSGRNICRSLLTTWRVQVAMTCLFALVGLFACVSLLDLHFSFSRRIAGRIRYHNRQKQRLQGLRANQAKQRELVDAINTLRASNPLHESESSGCITQTLEAVRPDTSAVIVEQQRLYKILSAYGILASITTHCTCAELRNLLLVSRGVRSAILGAAPPRLLWRKSICGQGAVREQVSMDASSRCTTTAGNQTLDLPSISKLPTYEECTGCAKAVYLCKICNPIKRPLLSPEITLHLWKCRPCCGPCFEEHHCRRNLSGELQVYYDSRRGTSARGPIAKFMPPECKCISDDSARTFAQLPENLMGDIDFYTFCSPRAFMQEYCRRGIFVSPPTVCEGCAEKSDLDLLAMRRDTSIDGTGPSWNCVHTPAEPEGSVRQDIPVAVEKVRGINCRYCEMRIPADAMVWWVCENCMGECMGSLHNSHVS